MVMVDLRPIAGVPAENPQELSLFQTHSGILPDNIIDLFEAKRAYARSARKTRGLDRLRETTQPGQELISQALGRDADYQPNIISANFAAAIDAQHRFGEAALHAVSTRTLQIYDEYQTVSDKIVQIQTLLGDSIPQGDIDFSNPEVESFLIKGQLIPFLYTSQERLLHTLEKKMRNVRVQPALTRRGSYYPSDEGFSTQLHRMRSDLHQDREIPFVESYQLTEAKAAGLVQRIRDRYELDLDCDEKICTLMKALGFFVQNNGKDNEVWYHEASPIAWLHILQQQEEAALATFEESRENNDGARAYLALSLLKQVREDTNNIEQVLVGRQSTYPKKFVKQMGIAMYRSHKVLGSTLDD